MAGKSVRDTGERLRLAIVERVAASRFAVPLGELYRGLPVRVSLGQFHDALRELHAAGRLRLSPWTQAMYQLQDPECCLLLGREIMAYATR